MTDKSMRFEDVCATVALREYEGIRCTALSHMFGQPSHWASKLCKEYPYHEVAEELQRLGAEELYKKYVTARHQFLLTKNKEWRTS